MDSKRATLTREERAAANVSAQRSTIKVEPKVSWPTLGDDNQDGRAAEIFFEKLEEIVFIANDGRGLPGRERLITLGNALNGSRKIIFENIIKPHRKHGDFTVDPGELYERVRDRLLRFRETTLEQQIRVKARWDNLYKGKSYFLPYGSKVMFLPPGGREKEW